MIKKFILFQFFAILFLSTYGIAAQSSADSSLTADQRKKALQEAVGNRIEKLHNQAEYVIGHGDVLTVSIFEEGDMAASTTPPGARGNQNTPRQGSRGGEAVDAPRPAENGIRVMIDGRISLRDIGDIEVVGLTLSELANYLKKLYSTIYEDPIVTTTLVQSNSLRYTVMGNVAAPGVFFLDYPADLVQVIARAGGFSEWANKKITVVRKQKLENKEKETNEITLKFEYEEFIKGRSVENNIQIHNGDIVIVH